MTTTAIRTYAAPSGSDLATPNSVFLPETDGFHSGGDRKRSEIFGTSRDQNWTLSERKWRRTSDELVSMSRKSAVDGVNRVQIGSGDGVDDVDGPEAS